MEKREKSSTIASRKTLTPPPVELAVSPSSASIATTTTASSLSSSTPSTATTATSSSTPRRNRYIRSSTASVTQLLSDSCNSLLQRFRRNPSERPEKKQNRFELSPSESAPDINSKNDSMSDRSRNRYNTSTSGYGSGTGIGGGGYTKTTTSSALDRLRSNLSPVSSYYKPLMRTFGRRDDESTTVSTTKVS